VRWPNHGARSPPRGHGDALVDAGGSARDDDMVDPRTPLHERSAGDVGMADLQCVPSQSGGGDWCQVTTQC
jgi:hypothetical protein